MRSIYRAALGVSLLVAIGSVAGGLQSQQKPSPQKATPQGDVERGKYLVENVAMCTECHTPRDANNQLEQDRWLQGAQIWIQPVHPTYNWGNFAPALAGLPSFTDEQVERVLEMGQGAGGTPIQPPMHIYHMTHADAQAVAAYLRSLPQAKQQR